MVGMVFHGLLISSAISFAFLVCYFLVQRHPITISQMDEFKERDLVKRSASGDMEAFDALAREHEGAVRAFFRIRIRDWAAADDLAQEVFVTAFKRVATFRGETRFRSWLHGIALNHLRNFLRKRQDVPVGGGQELQELIDEEIHLEIDDAFAKPGEGPDEGSLLSALKGCLDGIAQKSRDLLTERYVKQRTMRSIAEETDRGYSALNMQLLRLRERLAMCVRGKVKKDE